MACHHAIKILSNQSLYLWQEVKGDVTDWLLYVNKDGAVMVGQRLDSKMLSQSNFVVADERRDH